MGITPIKHHFAFPGTSVKRDAADLNNFVVANRGGRTLYVHRDMPYLALATPQNYPVELSQQAELEAAGINLLAIRRPGKRSMYLMSNHKFAMPACLDAVQRGEVASSGLWMFNVDTHNDTINPFLATIIFGERKSPEKIIELKNLSHENEIRDYARSIADEVGLVGGSAPALEKYLERISGYCDIKPPSEATYLFFLRWLFDRKDDVHSLSGGRLTLEEDTPWCMAPTYCGVPRGIKGVELRKNWEQKPNLPLAEFARILLTRPAEQTVLNVDTDAFFLPSERGKTEKIDVDVKGVQEFAQAVAPFNGLVTTAASPNYTHENSGLLAVRTLAETLYNG
ncbi:MAG: hypothetical protein PHH14_03710 [Candidatus Margulisbacteria bacterium]|nr:hypothetical protein [Candidatus Margulisiibacteriota bacterium]